MLSRLPPLNAQLFSALLAVLLMALYNQPLWSLILSQPQADGLGGTLFVAGLFLFFSALLHLLLTLFVPRVLLKPLALCALVSAAFVSYYMHTFGVQIDKTMIRNALETDLAETRELLTPRLFVWVNLLGLLPAWVLWRLPIRHDTLWQALKGRALGLLASLICIGAVLITGYQDMAGLFRNHRELRYLAVPTNYLYYGIKTLGGAYAQTNTPLQVIGKDARVQQAPNARPRLTLVVVGETARAESFGLDGYRRNTTPELARRDPVYFDNTWSCGTSTAVSVPCMFSAQGQSAFDEDQSRYTEGLLDVLAHAGIDTDWLDNNSGCKGACDRIPHASTLSFCHEEECMDETLLNALPTRETPASGDRVIVLHQKGSHGPAYYRRYPERFEHFTPVCDTSELQTCDPNTIVNAYDNSILYTDHVLARLIDRLHALEDTYDTAMIYVSDHGESLGESGLFLHGMPYLLAPEQQTRVPMLVWLSKGMAEARQLDSGCLRARRHERLSHDNLFHSVLGLMAVQTTLYQPDQDLFAPCRNLSGQASTEVSTRSRSTSSTRS
ncbi:phosphoethanolamine--lipid A transferase [Marinobacterium sp. AK62]|uniref:Phosphoethanolamine--lipid A transferase n=1 Tax=Marinobacterium alkalitolerans TaxID=1542925 RepID=A0ABS3ZDX6_9GAMM|nr:phosphoethanolamine--lipid A transferase [Marinobacterium alkalitolerans]MBP0049909.1 phosphoethanolamine--lipid A transferase [Marinobacterium alkalitolerans]